MFEKIEILFIILFLIVVFYIVIYFGAKNKSAEQSSEISSYLKGVRVLLYILTIVAFILWLFMK